MVPRLRLPLALIPLLWLLGCNPFPDPDNFPDFEGPDEEGIATVEDVCDRLEDCRLWLGDESCDDNLLTPETCSRPTSYRTCVTDCLEDDACVEFDFCESDCFTDTCRLGEDPVPF